MNDIKFIRANKCIIGEIYYLTGMWFASGNPLINMPVKFVGKGNNSNNGLVWSDCKGKHMFESLEDRPHFDKGGIVYTYSNDDMLLEPIKDPEILRTK